MRSVRLDGVGRRDCPHVRAGYLTSMHCSILHFGDEAAATGGSASEAMMGSRRTGDGRTPPSPPRSRPPRDCANVAEGAATFLAAQDPRPVGWTPCPWVDGRRVSESM